MYSELNKLREQIDKCDKQIAKAYAERLELVKKVGEYKKENNVEILNKGREAQVLENVLNFAGEYQVDVQNLFKYIMGYSREKQSDILKK